MDEFWWYVICGALGFLLLVSILYILYMKCAACCCSGILGCCCRCCCSSRNDDSDMDSMDNAVNQIDDKNDADPTKKKKNENLNYGTIAKSLLTAGFKAGFEIKKINLHGPGLDIPLTEKPFKCGTEVLTKLAPFASKGIGIIKKREMSIDEFKLIITWGDKNKSKIPLSLF